MGIDTDLILKALGTELRALREWRRLTPQEAVDRYRITIGVEISARTLMSYEHRRRDLSVRRLLDLARTYDVPVSGLTNAAIARAGGHPDRRPDRWIL